MGLFTRETSLETEKRLDARLTELEKKVETIDLEWSEWFDKFRRLYARISKRVERDRDPDEKGPSRPAEPRPSSGEGHTQPEPRSGLRRNLRGF